MGFIKSNKLAFSLWFMTVGATVMLIWRHEEFFALGGVPIGQITAASRDVSYRSEDDVRWRNISGNRQVVFDGDKLATGVNSSAVLDFGDGRVAQVSEDTSMLLSTIRQEKGVTYIITLPKGAVAIRNEGPSKQQKVKRLFPIIVRAGGKDFLIEPGQERGVVKSEKGVREFKGPAPKKFSYKTVKQPPVPNIATLNLAAKSSLTLVEFEEPDFTESNENDLDQVNESSSVSSNPESLELGTPPVPEISPVVEEPKVAPKKVETLPKPSSAPQLKLAPVDKGVKDPNGLEMTPSSDSPKKQYIFTSLKNAQGASPLEIKIARPKNTPPNWSPIIAYTSSAGRKIVDLTNETSLKLDWKNLLPITAIAGDDGVPCVTIAIAGGAKLQTSEGVKTSFRKDELNFVLCSYYDAAKNAPLLVQLSDLRLDRTKNPGPKSEGFPYQILVKKPEAYLKLIPMMKNSRSIQLTRASDFSASGVFIAEAGKVVMQLGGLGFKPEQSDFVMGVIGGDFVFKGAKDSLFDATSLTIDQLKEWVTKSTEQGRKIYLHRSGTLVPISRDFLEERREVAAFVKAVASQVFTDRVEIIAFK